MRISAEYLELNKRLHKAKATYGTSGHRYAYVVKDACKQLKTQDVLDYGCGKRTLEFSLGWIIKNYDPCIVGLDARPEPADIVVCSDVLEHVEPECLDDVLLDIWGLTKKCALFAIHLKPALKILEDGRNAHLTIQTEEWWKEKLQDYFMPLWGAMADSNTAFFGLYPLAQSVVSADPNVIIVGDNIGRGTIEAKRFDREWNRPKKTVEFMNGNLLAAR